MSKLSLLPLSRASKEKCGHDFRRSRSRKQNPSPLRQKSSPTPGQPHWTCLKQTWKKWYQGAKLRRAGAETESQRTGLWTQRRRGGRDQPERRSKHALSLAALTPICGALGVHCDGRTAAPRHRDQLGLSPPRE